MLQRSSALSVLLGLSVLSIFGPWAASAATPEVTMYDFALEYPNEDMTSVDFLGMDIIENTADTNVTQSVDHRKLFTQTITFEQSASFDFVLGIGLVFKPPEVSIIGVGVSLEMSALVNFGKGSTDTNSVSFSQEKEVMSSRTIQVPPYYSVQACSTATSASDFGFNYNALIRFPRSPQMSLDDLERTVQAAGYASSAKEGDSVRASMSGIISGSTPLHTQFYVTSNDSGDSNNCGALKRKFQERSHYRALSKYRGSVKETIEREIQAILQHMRGPPAPPKF